MDPPRYYKNTLELPQINKENLQTILGELRAAVSHGTRSIQEASPSSEDWGSTGLFLGAAGIALAFLRLNHQAPSLAEQGVRTFEFSQIVTDRLPPSGPDCSLTPGRLSPLGSSSPLAAAVMRILAAATFGDAVRKDDIASLHDAVKIALQNGYLVPHGGRMMGGDEALFGRAGLLLAILNVRVHEFDPDAAAYLQPVFDAVPDLIRAIFDAGRRGREEHIQKHGEKDALPLIRTWMEGHSGLGLVHGITGILIALLACQPSELNDGASRNYLPWIAGTISALCKICIANNGHLPTTIPARGSSSPFIQICHGSPGILLLMACTRRNTLLVSNFWEPIWDEAVYLASERTWEEGLLSKGGGICHGITGNAWPWLILHDSFEYDTEMMQIAKSNYRERAQTENIPPENELSGDYFLARALAFLLHARETPPYNMDSKKYRMPDHPFSLSEGLSGSVCAWADACVTIQTRLRKMELDVGGPISESIHEDPIFQQLESRQLGFPTLAYHRPTGLL